MERWNGKVAVVTGASAGIGAKISLRLANAGLRVVGLARRPELVDNLKTNISGSGQIYSKKCDISKREDVLETFAWIESKFGGTDVLVNNAGTLFSGSITDVGDNKITDESIVSMIDTNVKGLIMCTRQAVQSMKKRSFDGHIININSLAGHYTPFHSTLNMYPSTKSAVTAFSDALLNEFADNNCKIKVTSLSPGLVQTSMSVPDSASMPSLKPEDVADCVQFALSTPPHVNIYELGVCCVAEKRL